ncbi:hypothetical protein [Alkaliphilus metalliredigens]|nr:hypothetical protein [Alkaliphilus metalliredigens]
MTKKIIDFMNDNKQIENLLIDFYEAYYQNDLLKIYSFLDSSFQRAIPLNYFLIHSDYSIELGYLKAIKNICVCKEKNQAFAEVLLEFKENEMEIQFFLQTDYGGWKIDGDLFSKLREM